MRILEILYLKDFFYKADFNIQLTLPDQYPFNHHFLTGFCPPVYCCVKILFILKFSNLGKSSCWLLSHMMPFAIALAIIGKNCGKRSEISAAPASHSFLHKCASSFKVSHCLKIIQKSRILQHLKRYSLNFCAKKQLF